MRRLSVDVMGRVRVRFRFWVRLRVRVRLGSAFGLELALASASTSAFYTFDIRMRTSAFLPVGCGPRFIKPQ